MKQFTRIICLLLTLTLHNQAASAGSSFGGVNYYYLANYEPTERDDIVQTIVGGGAKVIRFFVGKRPYNSEKGDTISTSDDVETQLGVFNLAVLDRYDDLMYSINKKSAGKTKVILSLHNANNLAKGATEHECDVYCQYLHQNNMDWTRFYTDRKMTESLQERYRQILNRYQSKNWPGYTWSQLSDVILAIDLQNEPLVSQPKGTNFGTWICDIANFLRNDIKLSSFPKIGIATGATYGSDNNGDAPPAQDGPNWIQQVFDCPTVDIISFHGYYSGATPDQPWYDKFTQQPWGGVLRPKALNAGKLLMVEEFAYTGSQANLVTRQSSEIWAQAHSLNVRGIPWTYWDLRTGADGYCDDWGCNEVSVDGVNGSPWALLKEMFNEAYNAQTEFDWSAYFPVNHFAVLLVGPSNSASVSDGDGGCTWGCKGWTCSSSSPCSGDRVCSSGVCRECTYGCHGWACSASSPCSGDNECVNGVCKTCSWGCKGWQCGTQAPCKDSNECSNGVCRGCTWGCKGWACNVNTPCQGQLECTKGVCSACTFGCLGWNCNAQTTCKSVNQCHGGTCKLCDWGCPGWGCSANSPCQGDGECTGGKCGKCTWGCLGWACDAKTPCKGQNECVGGKCKPCSWGCLGWPCSKSTPCKSGYTCGANGVCKDSKAGYGSE